ncbi:MAG: GMC family oxidoreductase [Alphaproteobacteria bacterium]|nr:GMC family oxidoreductase [Alphaproteobacteria bacterium]
MIRNGKDIPDGTVIETQVCIVGSGPAGITAAWYLQKAGIKVTLIEGSRDFRDTNYIPEASWPDKELLYNGTADGLFATNERDFLIRPYAYNTSPSERERVFGGTSTHWGGQSRPLDPVTFEKRAYFPGWPINRQDLDPYYAKAAALCLLDPDFSAEHWAEVLDSDAPHLDGFDTEMYQFIGPNYKVFSTRPFEGPGGITIGESAADVILNASLLEMNHAQGVVDSLRVASMDDRSKKATEFTIKAGIVVLACGAVANAQQMLLSNVGNEYDQVGRYFIGHPIAQYGNTIVSIDGTYLTPSEKRFMDGDTLAGSRSGGAWVGKSGETVEGRFSPNAEQQRALGIGSCWFWAYNGQYYFELAPDPDSRVTLADTLDPVFGQRQTRITWKLSDRDEETYNQTTRLFTQAVAKRHATVTVASWDFLKSKLMVNGHHIGITRMSDDPKQGVVDKNLKVHSLHNLYVAGSSVFPTAGISNPTFTIITLSIRLAEHLIAALAA